MAIKSERDLVSNGLTFDQKVELMNNIQNDLTGECISLVWFLIVFKI